MIASADLPPATRHLRTRIPLASRGARPEHVQSSCCRAFGNFFGASWVLGGASGRPAGGLWEASWGPLGA
eukprot:9497606-Pyramimonas_sp.AAC.1